MMKSIFRHGDVSDPILPADSYMPWWGIIINELGEKHADEAEI